MFGNHDMYYTTRINDDVGSNAYIENNNLVIEAREEVYEGENYTSAMIRTKDLKSFKYDSKLVIVAKLPSTKGIFPAFWCSSQSETYPTRQLDGEIDLMEFINTNLVYGTLWAYWIDDLENYNDVSEFDIADYHSEYITKSITNEELSQNYHTYKTEWYQDRMKFFIDGTKIGEISYKDYQSDLYKPFQQEFYLRLNVAVGGAWAGSPDESSEFPQKMYIDSVKYYRRVGRG